MVIAFIGTGRQGRASGIPLALPCRIYEKDANARLK